MEADASSGEELLAQEVENSPNPCLGTHHVVVQKRKQKFTREHLSFCFIYSIVNCQTEEQRRQSAFSLANVVSDPLCVGPLVLGRLEVRCTNEWEQTPKALREWSSSGVLTAAGKWCAFSRDLERRSPHPPWANSSPDRTSVCWPAQQQMGTKPQSFQALLAPTMSPSSFAITFPQCDGETETQSEHFALIHQIQMRP